MTNPKLTAEQRAEVRRLYESTKHLPATVKVVEANPERWSLAKLGQRYGVSRETIRRALAELDGATDAE